MTSYAQTTQLADHLGSKLLGWKGLNVYDKLDALPITTKDYGAVADGVTPDQAAVQLSVVAAQGINGAMISASGGMLISSSVLIDRPVDSTVGDLNVGAIGFNAGFVIPDATINLFDSSFAVTTTPLSECVNFNNLLFAGTNPAASAYVMSPKFLRYSFIGCRFNKIKIVNTPIYVQSVRISDSSAWRWSGPIFQTAGQAYDFHLNNTRHEAGGGGYNLALASGCSFVSNMFEGCTGPFVKIGGANGLFVGGNYTEGNSTTDFIFTDVPGSGVSNGIAFVGNSLLSAHGLVNVTWGNAVGASIGNYSNGAGAMHNVASTRLGHFTSIGDYSVSAKFSDSRFWEGTAAGVAPLGTTITAFAGGGQASATQLAKPVNRITVCATANDSVALPATDDVAYGDYAKFVMVANSGAATLAVYYAAADRANFGSTNAILASIPTGQTRIFLSTSQGVWSVVGGGIMDTGWTAMTGTGSKATLAAAAAGTSSAAYVQAEAQGALNRIAALEARLKSLDAALFANGSIGA